LSDSAIEQWLQQQASKKRVLCQRRHLELDPVTDQKCSNYFTWVGSFMQHYHSCKDLDIKKVYIKGFQTIPYLANWEELLLLTRPDTWNSEATYLATIAFLAADKNRQMQSFLQWVLLPQYRRFIRNHQFLDRQLHLSLCKVMLAQPSLFCKALLVPLCESGCSLKEASIFGDVLQKATNLSTVTVTTTLCKLADLPTYSQAVSVFITILVQKCPKHLSYRVTDALIDHFAKSVSTTNPPALWQHAFMAFVDS
ncbi:hypothetical protein DM01DRAFT_1394265, partial [Hesseltinella vesiculosa]